MAADADMMDLFEFDAIPTAPVYTLAECIAAKANHKAEFWEEFEDCTDPAEEIKKRFRSALPLCNAREQAFIKLMAELAENKAAWAQDVAYYPFRVFAQNDFAYLYLWNGQYHLVMPAELLAVYNEVISDENFTANNAQKLEMTDYAAAMLNLYGAYEADWFATVWNHHHKDKITKTEAEGFLSDRAYFHSDYYFYDWFVVHDCLTEDEFEDLWETAEKLDYYMPTKQVIREYAHKGHDNSKISGEREMENFLAGYIQDDHVLEFTQFGVKWSCERLQTPEEVRDVLADAGAPLKDGHFCAEFERLYNSLRENTHIWELKGFTPYQYQMQTGECISRFQLPKGKTGRKKG